jgi:hypothetical protein
MRSICIVVDLRVTVDNIKSFSIATEPPECIPTLTLWRGLCGHMIPRAMLAVAYVTGRASHARQVKGDDPNKKGYPGPPG